jgi:hypothetical protein
MLDRLLDALGNRIARHIAAPPAMPRALALLAPYARVLRPGDVLLVDGGHNKVSAAIKYLTQSTWSHAALYVGEGRLVEAEVGLGIVESPLEKYAGFHLRICRPVGLESEQVAAVIGFARSRLGGRYDLRNVLDLARWLFPFPPVPRWMRRRMIAFGSGEPTRAICSSLIAEAFNSIGYPILPEAEKLDPLGEQAEEAAHIRHHSLYAPRDFDASPYFAVVKPTLEEGFDYRCMPWAGRGRPEHCASCGKQVLPLRA